MRARFGLLFAVVAASRSAVDDHEVPTDPIGTPDKANADSQASATVVDSTAARSLTNNYPSGYNVNGGYESGPYDGYNDGPYDGYNDGKYGQDDGYNDGPYGGYKNGPYDDYNDGKYDGYNANRGYNANGGYKNGPYGGYKNGPYGGYKNGPYGGYKNGPYGGYKNGPYGGYKSGPYDGYKNGKYGQDSGYNGYGGYKNGLYGGYNDTGGSADFNYTTIVYVPGGNVSADTNDTIQYVPGGGNTDGYYKRDDTYKSDFRGADYGYNGGYDSHNYWSRNSADAPPYLAESPSQGQRYPDVDHTSDYVYGHYTDSDDGCPSQPCHELATVEHGKCVYRQLAPGTLCAGQSCNNGGPCDDDEKDYCDSTGTCVDGYRIETYVPCRPAVSACDVPEYCNGKQSQCPMDRFSPRTQKCIGHSNGGDCDTTDYCDGRGHCVDAFRGPSFVCRPARDDCDAPERCSGHSGKCPRNSFADKSTDCTRLGKSSRGPCDARDRCDGKGNCIDRFHGPDHVCRKPRDVCDVPEYCTGDSNACPDDEFADTSVVCTDIGDSSHGSCDGVDYCDGRGNCIDRFLDCDQICRKQHDVCDLPEYCTGVHGSCPRDEFADSGTVCTPIGASSNGPCDAIDYCNGRGTCIDNFNVDTLCYNPRGFCDSGRFCDGTSGACPAAGYDREYVLLADDASMTEVIMQSFRLCSAKVTEGLVSVDGAMPSHSVYVLLAGVALVAVVVAIVVTKVKPLLGVGKNDDYTLVTETV
ncbi:hypothetical protein SPRG_00484 [Saprolegnia parasitica CBS 223.65]|uniref:Disintegrin domain-containing protein n=1 Tax=Saprolegnia parasitica (strain CBS 223.65) TaxID=695850 RepID=A0A067D2C7_SAPPC|nr:hypothetical protein SPRG_00484 [Saprolegnia parasitica CBS 223.65]KDO35640.1 hypothetical protein SPRG_00484 [Saprolegnia parasitica CBS 223.65]|eukprot:XP_012193968.1 hypothetical protein SPRG_00484 [Saprolegnia parasitica CBS 223.65]